MALQSQDPRPKWSSSSNVGYRSTSGANFVGKTSASSTMVSAGLAITSATSTCDIRSGTKFGNLARQRHLSGRKRKSRSHLKSRSSALPPAVLSPYSQPPTLQPHFVQQSGVPHHSVALLPQHPSSAGSGTKQPPQLVHHQLQQQQDLDLYLNSSASNVSPDSGIQSEGGVNNSSPLHLGDVTVNFLVEAPFFDFPKSRQKVRELILNFEQALPVLRQSRDSQSENLRYHSLSFDYVS